MAKHELKSLSNDPLTHLDDEGFTNLAHHQDTGGCFWIIPGVVGICWSINGTTIKVCLRLVAVDVVCQNIDPSNPCVKLEGNVFCAKASIEVCFKNNCLTYDAQACYKDFPCLGSWKCTESKGTIVCF